MAFKFLNGRNKLPAVELTEGVYHAGVRLFQNVVAADPGTEIDNPAGVPADIFATVSSSNANHMVILPEPIVGTRVSLYGGATGYELRSSDPTTVAINGGTGADAESAIAASLLLECRCVSTTAWICNNYAAAGTEAAEEAAA